MWACHLSFLCKEHEKRNVFASSSFGSISLYVHNLLNLRYDVEQIGRSVCYKTVSYKYTTASYENNYFIHNNIIFTSRRRVAAF